MIQQKKIIVSFSLLAFSLFLNSSVLAVESTGSNTYRDIRSGVKTVVSPNVTPVKQIMQENRQLIKQEKTDLKATLGANREQLSDTVLANMINMLNTRLSNAIARLNKRADLLETIAVKIEERLSAIEIENGVTLTESRSLVAQAKTEIAKSRTLISAIKIDTTITTKEELELQRTSLKTQVETVYQNLKKVSELLRQSVNKAFVKSVSLTPRVKPTSGFKSTITPGARKGIPVPTYGYNTDQ